MKRIGIIGCENSHAEHFARIINLSRTSTGDRLYPDMEVVAVFGPEIESARAVQAAGDVETIVDSAEDFIGLVDAMMITNRSGSLHADYAKPFIEAGIPLFIDKPVTANWEEARELVRSAEEKGVPIAGGSGCKYAWDVKLLKHKTEAWNKDGELLSASMNFAADRDSIYDGFYFYGPHLTEMALTVFGFNPKSVQAYENEGGVLAVLRYDAYDISLHYTKNSRISSCTLYGQNDNEYRRIDISMIYQHEVDYFVEMLRTGNMPQTYTELIAHVGVISAINESLDSGKAVELF